MFDEFEVVPAIDIEDGDVVQLVGGERGTATSYGDPTTAAKRWVDHGARTLHLVDLDGAFEGNRSNAAAVEAIESAVDVPIQLGGGIRSAASARSLLDSGIDRVILGTAALADPSIVERISSTHPESVIVSLDAADGEVVVSGWTESTGLDPVDAAERYVDIGATGVLFTDVDREGQMEGVRTEPIRRLSNAISVPVIASGGVSTIDDVLAIRDAGAAACVVGTALYEGAFTLEAAQAALDTERS